MTAHVFRISASRDLDEADSPPDVSSRVPWFLAQTQIEKHHILQPSRHPESRNHSSIHTPCRACHHHAIPRTAAMPHRARDRYGQRPLTRETDMPIRPCDRVRVI